jgi:hypothetical protein
MEIEANMRNGKRFWDMSRVVCSCVATLAASGLPAFAQTVGGTNQDVSLRLEISTNQRTYPKGEQVSVHVRLTNVSSHDVFVGRDMWTNASPSRVTLSVSSVDGHPLTGWDWAGDGPPSDPVDIAKAMLKWCLLLPPKYSYSSSTTLQSFVSGSGLVPGTYKIRAIYSSSGIDANVYFNPLINNPDERTRFRDENWSGEIASNEVVVDIVDRLRGSTRK